MKKHFNQFVKGLAVPVLAATLLLACKKDASVQQTAAETNSTTTTTPRVKTAYQLVWQDEFDGTSLNTAKWGYENGNLGVNNEKQYYQTQNVTVSGGNLVITARKQTVSGQPYTSGRINTNNSSNKFSIRYGRIEARMKLPMVQGTWPAFWMLGTNITDPNVGWPKCGEIDIMEQVNTNNNVLGTIHWDNNGYVYYSNSTNTTPGDYHVYAVEWDASAIRWYVDNNLYATANIANNINGTDEFHKNFFILLNLAIGGNLPGNTINDAAFPTSMYVDYVRVYSQTNSTAPVGQTVTLKGINNAFVSSENGTQAMTCTRTTAGDWERFTIVDAGDGKVALQSMGKYVSSENGTQPITCSRTSISDWEKFTLETTADGKWAFKGNNGRYISSENGTQAMTCNRTSISGWEAFTH
ncbi:family 16 glycosylhydrolase [Mucilaginibacter sp. Bleaf8]|uniref:family 16 glycosylhydrolase n=1 Tax=Mucilaginibacter sp. Bleaf8 TaxID=2834430 RepID=UPI001BCD788B|nr:family 16 glycosylhydrolase [Mucilaginibacter sp. Bleaf8]MBS7564112.1 family 16 glycosylhydrolase [Mucilaginibacter sp. Bleaf8]